MCKQTLDELLYLEKLRADVARATVREYLCAGFAKSVETLDRLTKEQKCQKPKQK